MLAFGYLPKNDCLGIFGTMLRDLRAFRLEAKRQAKAAAGPIERNRLEALQATFKILINSAYGYLAFPHGHFADFEAAAAVTAKGREILQEMVDWLLSGGARVVEIDTDGIYFSPPEGVDVQELTRKLAAELPEGIMLELGEHYPAMFSYRSKNAAFLKADGSMIVKGGALRSRGMEPYLRRYLQTTLRLLLEGRPDEVGALYDGLVRQITLRELPVTDFAQSQTLHVPLEEYRGAVEAGKRTKDAALELAIKSGRAYAVGDQLSYYMAVGDATFWLDPWGFMLEAVRHHDRE
jgi:DNA polymerase I